MTRSRSKTSNDLFRWRGRSVYIKLTDPIIELFKQNIDQWALAFSSYISVLVLRRQRALHEILQTVWMMYGSRTRRPLRSSLVRLSLLTTVFRLMLLICTRVDCQINPIRLVVRYLRRVKKNKNCQNQGYSHGRFSSHSPTGANRQPIAHITTTFQGQPKFPHDPRPTG